MGAAVRRRSWFGWALFSSGSAHERRHLLACVRGCYRAMKNALRLEVTDKFKLFFSFFLPPPPPLYSVFDCSSCIWTSEVFVRMLSERAFAEQCCSGRGQQYLTVKISQAINLSREVESASTLLASMFTFPFEPKQMDAGVLSWRMLDAGGAASQHGRSLQSAAAAPPNHPDLPKSLGSSSRGLKHPSRMTAVIFPGTPVCFGFGPRIQEFCWGWNTSDLISVPYLSLAFECFLQPLGREKGRPAHSGYLNRC